MERPGRGPEVPRLRACPVTPPLQTAEGTHVSRRTRSLAAVGPGAMDRTSPSQIHMLRPSPPRDSSGDGARRRQWRLEGHTVGPDPQRWCLVRGRDERKPAVCHVRTWARAAVGAQAANGPHQEPSRLARWSQTSASTTVTMPTQSVASCCGGLSSLRHLEPPSPTGPRPVWGIR